MATLTVETHGKKAMLVSGDTVLVKDFLRELGGSWNKGLSSWVFPGSKKDDVIQELEVHSGVREVRCVEGPADWAFPGSKKDKKGSKEGRDLTALAGAAAGRVAESNKRVLGNAAAANTQSVKRQSVVEPTSSAGGNTKLVVEVSGEIRATVLTLDAGSLAVDIRKFRATQEGGDLQPTQKGILLTCGEWTELAGVMEQVGDAFKDSATEAKIQLTADVDVIVRKAGGCNIELCRRGMKKGIQMSSARWAIIQSAADRISAAVGV